MNVKSQSLFGTQPHAVTSLTRSDHYCRTQHVRVHGNHRTLWQIFLVLRASKDGKPQYKIAYKFGCNIGQKLGGEYKKNHTVIQTPVSICMPSVIAVRITLSILVVARYYFYVWIYISCFWYMTLDLPSMKFKWL